MDYLIIEWFFPSVGKGRVFSILHVKYNVAYYLAGV